MTSGRGYVPAEEQRHQQTTPSASFRWIRSTPPVCNYCFPTVENTRVRDLTDYDKLTLGMNDATISARDAVSLGAKVLRDHLDLFVNLSRGNRLPSPYRC